MFVVLNDYVQNDCLRFLIFGDFKYTAAGRLNQSCVLVVINLSASCLITNGITLAFNFSSTGCAYQ